MVCHDRSLIGPPLLDDRASSTIEHDIMRRVREWMADGRVPSGLHEGLVPRSIGGYEDMLRPEIVDPRANVRSHFLNGLRIHMPGWIDTRTVLMDGSLHL